MKNWKRHCYEEKIDIKIDYKKLVETVSKDTNLLRAYFYDGIAEKPSKQKILFLESLQKRGIQTKTKILKRRYYRCQHCNHLEEKEVQKGVDVSLATDILNHAWQRTCDICVLISGDEDYKDAINVAKDKGVKVWVVSFKKSLSRELMLSADKTIIIEDILPKILRNS